MKRNVDLRNPSSLEEAISLATQFESFDLREGHGPVAGRGETRPSRGRSAHVQAEEQSVSKREKYTNEELASLRKQIEILISRESKAEKASKTIAELDQRVSELTEQVMMMIFVINVFRRQGCPHLGQGHGPIVSSRHRI